MRFAINSGPATIDFPSSAGHRLIAWLYYFISKNNFLRDIPHCHGRQLNECGGQVRIQVAMSGKAAAVSVACPPAWDASAGGLYYH